MTNRKYRLKTWGITAASAAAVLLGACGAAAAATETEPEAAPKTRVYSDQIQISELMAKNKAVVDDGSGTFPDWIELTNTGTETVDLSGWGLSDREERVKWRFPACVIAPGEFLLVYADGRHPAGTRLTANFGLSEGETLVLSSPDGEPKASAVIQALDADVSQVFAADGSWSPCRRPTPGYPNTQAGYLDFLGERPVKSPLLINEVLVQNQRFSPEYLTGYSDIVELKNVSDEPILLSDYGLADRNDTRPSTLPEKELAPGELFLVYCSGDSGSSTAERFHVDFALSADVERLYLYGKDGTVADYMLLRDIPADGSYGRLPDQAGLYYFRMPTPDAENADGLPFVSARPRVSVEPGVYEQTEALCVSLLADQPGTRIYYTTDGTVPDESAQLYTAPVEIASTTILRAIAVEENALPSRVGTFSYMLNEQLRLPLVSIVADDLPAFREIYYAGLRENPVTANVSFFDGEHSFSKDGELTVKGWTSRSLPKKSMGVAFKSSMDGMLEADVFSNGVTRFSDLSIRAGQDNLRTLFRTELVQDLVLESDSDLLVQSSRFCVVYLNGEYWGIYALKEDLTAAYYAEHYGVSRDSVEVEKGEVALSSDFYRDVIGYALNNDMADDRNYAYMCRTIDVDSFIDWIIFEGYSGNTDVLNNIRFFRSDEGDGLWRWALYDLDWAFYNPNQDYAVIMNAELNTSYQMYQLMMELFKNEQFKSAFLARFGQLNRGVLSNAHVVERIEHYAALLEPEIARDEKLRRSSYDSWRYWVEELEIFILENDWENHNVRQLARFLNMSEENVRAGMAA